MSPKQAEGAKTLNGRADIWAMGVIAFECWLGSRPFDEETLGGLLPTPTPPAKPAPVDNRVNLGINRKARRARRQRHAAKPHISAMLASMLMTRFGWRLTCGLGLLFMGCVEPPGAERIVGPDGTQMLHVHCGNEQVACFQLAGERCPHGYDLSPIFDPHDGNFLVRCRNPALTRAIVASAPAQPTPGAQSRAAADGWPPSEVATPTEPWPTASPSALPPTPRTATGAVDIGY